MMKKLIAITLFALAILDVAFVAAQAENAVGLEVASPTGYTVNLAAPGYAAEFIAPEGTRVYLGDQDHALSAVNSSVGTLGYLGTPEAGVFGTSVSHYTGLFRGKVGIEGETSLINQGRGAVLLNLGIDRTWHLRQFGSGAGTALELASIGGGGNKNFLISTTGLVGIGTNDPRAKLHVNGNVLATAFNQTSSRRWKKEIEDIDGALSLVNKLRGVSYQWKADDRHDIGLIAEEVGTVVPEVVEFEENGIDARSIDYTRLVPLLIECIKEIHATVKQQQVQIDNLGGGKKTQ